MDIKASLERVLESKETLGNAFYAELLKRFPELRDFFRDVDLARQAVLLTMQLSVIEVYYATRSPAAEKYLQVLGTKHRDWGIPQEVYSKFCDVLIDVLAEFHGEDWDDDAASQWRAAIDAARAKMLEGYDQRFVL